MTRIAIPLAEGRLALHFGHCQNFALIDVDPEEGKVLERRDSEPPPHAPGVLPRWLSEQGVNVVIAGGMGQRAQTLFAHHGIELLVGAPSEPPEDIVAKWLDGSLATGENVCDH